MAQLDYLNGGYVKPETPSTQRGPALARMRTTYGTPGSKSAGASSAGGGMTSHYETWSNDRASSAKSVIPSPLPSSGSSSSTAPSGRGEPLLPSEANKQKPEDMLKAMIDAQYRANVAALQNAYKANLSEIEKSQSAIADRYLQARTDQDVQSMLLEKRLRESLGSSGVASGDILGANVSLMAANRGALGSLTTEEQQQYDLLENMKVQLRQALEADIAAAKQNAEAERMEQLLNSQQYQDQLALQAAPFTGELFGQPTLQAQELMRAASGSQSQSTDPMDLLDYAFKRAQYDKFMEDQNKNPNIQYYMDSLSDMFTVAGMPVQYGTDNWQTAANNAEQFIQALLSSGAVDRNDANLLRSIYIH